MPTINIKNPERKLGIIFTKWRFNYFKGFLVIFEMYFFIVYTS